MGASGEGFWFLDGSFRLRWAGNHPGILTREWHDQIRVWEAALTSAWKTSGGRKSVQEGSAVWGKGRARIKENTGNWKDKEQTETFQGQSIYFLLLLLLWLPPCFSHIRHRLASWPFSLPRLLCPWVTMARFLGYFQVLLEKSHS